MPATFLTNPFRSKLAKAMKSKPVLAAVAYVSDVSGLPMGPGDILVCDASDEVARFGGTTKAALRALVDAGVAVWSLPNLHAKVVVCGDRATVGSANWSLAAENRKIEAGVEIGDSKTVEAAKAFVRSLSGSGAIKVDKGFLKRMPDVVPRDGEGGRVRRFEDTVSYWLMAADELPDTEENRQAEAGFQKLQGEGEGFKALGGDPIWFLYKDNFAIAGRIAGGDMLTMIYDPGDIDVYVYPPRLVLKALTMSSRIGILTLAPFDEEKRKVPWPTFQKAAIEAGVRKNVTKGSCLELKRSSYEKLTSSLWKRRSKSR